MKSTISETKPCPAQYSHGSDSRLVAQTEALDKRFSPDILEAGTSPQLRNFSTKCVKTVRNTCKTPQTDAAFLAFAFQVPHRCPALPGGSQGWLGSTMTFVRVMEAPIPSTLGSRIRLQIVQDFRPRSAMFGQSRNAPRAQPSLCTCQTFESTN